MTVSLVEYVRRRAQYEVAIAGAGHRVARLRWLTRAPANSAAGLVFKATAIFLAGIVEILHTDEPRGTPGVTTGVDRGVAYRAAIADPSTAL